jgi:hypothetical protein
MALEAVRDEGSAQSSRMNTADSRRILFMIAPCVLVLVPAFVFVWAFEFEFVHAFAFVCAFTFIFTL